MEIPTTATGELWSCKGEFCPRDNPTPEKTFVSLVQGQPDQTWVEEKGMGMSSSSLPLLIYSFPLLFQ